MLVGGAGARPDHPISGHSTLETSDQNQRSVFIMAKRFVCLRAAQKTGTRRDLRFIGGLVSSVGTKGIDFVGIAEAAGVRILINL